MDGLTWDRLTADDLGAGLVMFTHVGEDGEQVTYSIHHMQKLVSALYKAGKLRAAYVAVDRDFAKYCQTNRGIENHRLERITAEMIKTRPIFMLEMPDGSHLLADGHHRYVKASKLRLRTIRAFLLPKEVWEPCIVHGMPLIADPKQFLAAPSGL